MYPNKYVRLSNSLSRQKRHLSFRRQLLQRGHRQLRINPYRQSPQCPRRNPLCSRKISDHQLIGLRKQVRRKGMRQIRRRGDHRLRRQQRCHTPRPVIGAAQMPGQEGYAELPPLIQHQHRRILRLVRKKRRDQPHRDSRRPDEDDDVLIPPVCRNFPAASPIGKLSQGLTFYGLHNRKSAVLCA